MLITNPSSTTVSLPLMESISGAIMRQMQGSSGVSMDVLSQTGAALMAAVSALSGNSMLGGHVTWTVPVPTGISSLTVRLPTRFAAPPLLTWGISTVEPVTYLANPQQITASGFVVHFSDTVLEPGVTLTTTAAPAIQGATVWPQIPGLPV